MYVHIGIVNEPRMCREYLFAIQTEVQLLLARLFSENNSVHGQMIHSDETLGASDHFTPGFGNSDHQSKDRIWRFLHV